MNKFFAHIGRMLAVATVLLAMVSQLHAQKAPHYSKVRILFVMDASGSMQGKWQDATKFEIAQNILINVLDSLYQKNPDIEFGLRLFGHQSPKAEKNCEDTNLEIDFSYNNKAEFQELFKQVKPQGQTPIAFTLYQSINDFPDDAGVKNVIILITDGLESCDGNPCAVTPLLQQNNIALRPFVIGLGLELENEDYFDCVGKFFNADNKPSLEKVMNVVISQAMNNTTTEIRLLDGQGNATLFDIPISIYNSRTHASELNLVNARGYRGEADTIFISPVNNYDVQVHSLPPVWKRNVELNPGKHNIIPIDLPVGNLIVKRRGFRRIMDVNCVLRSEDYQILKVFPINSQLQVIRGNYYLEILTLPCITKEIKIEAGSTEVVEVPTPGKVTFSSSRPGIYSVYTMEGNEPNLVYENENFNRKETLELLPGAYFAVFRQYKYKSSKLTKTKEFEVNSNSSTSIWF